MANIAGDELDNALFGGAEDDRIDAGAGNDTVYGMAGNDTVFGDAGDDLVWPGPGNDLVYGGAGNDRLWNTAGYDTLDGGDGDDAIESDAASALFGGLGNDNLLVSPFALAPSRLEGGAGNDTLQDRNEGSTLEGGDGDDSVVGAAYGAMLLGGNGRDTLSAYLDFDEVARPSGFSTLVGGAGDDRYFVNSPQFPIIEKPGEGKDTVVIWTQRGGRFEIPAQIEIVEASNTGRAADGPLVVLGGDGPEHLIGVLGLVLLDGGAGADTLEAAGAVGTLLGGAGDDLLTVQAAGSGMVADGGEGNDRLLGNNTVNLLFGGAGNDELQGYAGDDSLFGGSGDDTLIGGDGNDMLEGGPGADLLRGGNGADTYVINDLNDTVDEDGNGGSDTAVIGVNGLKLTFVGVEQVRYTNDALPLAYWIDALTTGRAWGPTGQGAEVKFAFLTAADLAEFEGFTPFAEADRLAARQALALWAKGTGLRVREVDVDTADVVFSFADLADTGLAGLTLFDPEQQGAIVVISDDAKGGALFQDAQWQEVLLHEAGHALGLKHPGNYNGVAGVGQPPYLPASEDIADVTLMSYNRLAPRDANDTITALPAFDAATVQYLYGVAPTVNAGDTLWRYSVFSRTGHLLADGSGVDTLDASDVAATPGAAVDMTIDLRQGARIFAGHAAELITAPGQVSINYGSSIEHALGSAGNDAITGNWGDNRLSGGAGRDTLMGLAGNDTLLGGEGDDLLIDYAGQPSLLDGDAGDDVLAVLVSTVDSAGAMVTLSGGAGRDALELRISPELLDLHAVQAILRLQEQIAIDTSNTVLGLRFGGLESLRWRLPDGAPMPNQRPFAVAGDLAMDEDTIFVGKLPRAVDLEGDALRYAAVENYTDGRLVIDEDGSTRYTPWPDFFGEFVFYYRVRDAGGSSAIATQKLIVRPVDDAPVLVYPAMDASTEPGAAFRLQLNGGIFTDVDTPVLQHSLTLANGRPLPAWLSFDPVTQVLSGVASAADLGVINIRWTVTGASASVSTQFVVGVTPLPNRVPAFAKTELSVMRNASLLLPQAQDADGDPVSYQLALPLRHGAISVDAQGRWTYTPEKDYFGSDELQVIVRDGRGGSQWQRLLIAVETPDHLPVGNLLLTGAAVVGQRLVVVPNFTDEDGLGPVFYQWLRDGVFIPDRWGDFYILNAADIGARISAQAIYTDGQYHPSKVVSNASAVVTDFVRLNGTLGADRLVAGNASTRVEGLDGNDSLQGGSAFDQLEGGNGDDVLMVSPGGDWLSGGSGRDVLVLGNVVGATVNLAQQWLKIPGQADQQVFEFEGVVGSPGADILIGQEDYDPSATSYRDTFRGLGGGDRIDGLSGIDTAEFVGARSLYRLANRPDAAVIEVTRNGATVADELRNIERIRFDDVYLAFGNRAEEVARVAFALWSKDIAGAKDLFARGISYYDNGYDFNTLVRTALTYFSGDSDAQLAERLARNIPSSSSSADVLRLIEGRGGGEHGRAFATVLMAFEPGNLDNIELAGLRSQGIQCSLMVDGVLLFPAMPG